MGSADAGVSQDDIAIGVSSDDQDLFAINLIGIAVVDDEDVLENGSVL